MTHSRPKAFTLVQLILVMFVLAVFIRVAFRVGDPSAQQQSNRHASMYKHDGPYIPKIEKSRIGHGLTLVDDEQTEAQTFAVVPFKDPTLRDSERGPLLARVLRQYRPLTTDEQVDGLVDTLPPNANPRVIVLIPNVEKPETPDAEKSPCRVAPHHDEVDDDPACDTCEEEE